MKTTKILSLTLALSIAGQTCAIGLPSWLTKSTVQGVKTLSMAPAPSLQTVQKISAPLATIIASPLAQMAKPSSFDKYKNIILSRNGLYVIGGVVVTLLIASFGLWAKKKFWPKAPVAPQVKSPVILPPIPAVALKKREAELSEELKQKQAQFDIEKNEKEVELVKLQEETKKALKNELDKKVLLLVELINNQTMLKNNDQAKRAKLEQPKIDALRESTHKYRLELGLAKPNFSERLALVVGKAPAYFSKIPVLGRYFTQKEDTNETILEEKKEDKDKK